MLFRSDEGAVKELHKDNVRLRDCPPPFSVAYQSSENGLYCHADMNNIKYIKESEFASKDLKVIDNGAVITDSTMNEILNHPWQEQPEKEKTRRVPSCFEEISNEYKRIYNPSESQLGD